MLRDVLSHRRMASYVLPGRTATNTHHVLRSHWLAFALAFLVAVAASTYVMSRGSQVHRNTTVENNQTTQLSTESAANDEAPAVPADSTAESVQKGEASISTQTRLENGKAQVEVSVNGQPVEIAPEGTTQKTITDPDTGSQANLNVTIQNNQVNTSMTSGSSSFVNSFSTNFQSNFQSSFVTGEGSL